MFVDAAVDLLEAFRALEAGILDVQAEVDALEAEIEEEDDHEALSGETSITAVKRGEGTWPSGPHHHSLDAVELERRRWVEELGYPPCSTYAAGMIRSSGTGPRRRSASCILPRNTGRLINLEVA